MITQPLPRDGGMAVDHEVSGVMQHPRVWTTDHQLNYLRAKNRKTENIYNIAMHNEMRDMVGR